MGRSDASREPKEWLSHLIVHSSMTCRGRLARARQGSAATSAGSERRRTRTSLSMLRRIASAAVGETSYPDRSSMAPAHATLRSESLSSLARTPFGDGPIGTAPDAFAVYVWVISLNFLTA